LIAVFLGYLLYPAVKFLTDKKIPKSLAYLFVFIFIFGLFYALGLLITINVNAFLENLPAYELRLQQIFEQVSGLIKESGIIQRFGLEDKFSLRNFQFYEYISIEKITSYIGSSLGSFIGIVGNILVVVFFIIFILMEADRITARVKWA
jgi:AI-2 transport protein TqsA